MKSSSIAIIGKPNSGKSTLFNYLVGERLSIITPKAQTTRDIITGILTVDKTQLIILDAPGIFDSSTRLEKYIVKNAWSSINGADVIIFLIDASSRNLDDNQINILKKIVNKNIILVFNKIDLKINDDLIAECANIAPLAKLFYISALKGDNVKELLDYLVDIAKECLWLYDEDTLTTLPVRFLAAEITREQLFLLLQQELPYNLKVEPESWQQLDDGSIEIRQAIVVNKESHKKIIIGSKGDMIKRIGINARENIKKYMGINAHLFLFIKVRENWQEKLKI